ncbi:uncharacterized protein C05D11.1 isoform X1 [Hydra vulgaris]|uniref:uncharacterized protein C05D11.1 isoform X1 n=1 Tax=Hydra vulgaris TaxID=6087 RepID=UPI001F5FAC68|nr:uncharacterized protein C05D11.1 [Hydra vulgaris]
MENYELLSTAVVSGIIPVKKYRSKQTGFTVCIGFVDGPIVNGYFCLATEAHDDDGLPHTLEHLIFMGSEEYPYKGMLDLFANRCLAQGTNAWTDTDHTCYTMTTAGSEGFLNLLPIYLDHVLYPTLTQSAYHTEVHHINGAGENAGVVYCEMQARENTGHSLTHLNFLRAMYPGKCGYKSETGGIMKNLRTTCSHEKVRKYHSEFYRADNLCLIITGKVNPEDVFRVIKPFEDKIISKANQEKKERPWSGPVPPLEKECNEQHIIFPTDDESTGLVAMGWRGPNVLDYYGITALNILLIYLTESTISPLQRELVQCEEPMCGDVNVCMMENKESSFYILTDNVPKENIFLIKEKVLDICQNIANGNEAIDMERMVDVIHKAILEEMNALEDHPHDTLSHLVIGDFLFSAENDDLQSYVNKVGRLKNLKQENADFWVELLKKYIVDQKMVVVVGEPSEELMKKMGDEEKTRLTAQADQLGPEGLEQMKKELEAAIKENEREPAKEIINSLPIPSPESLSFHQIDSFCNLAPPSNLELAEMFPINSIPCAFYVYHVNSLFTTLIAIIDTSNLSEDSRILLPLYSEILFESPIKKDGVIIPYEEVVKQIDRDTLNTNASIGVKGCRFSTGTYSNLLVITIKVENEKYTKGVEWLRDILYNLQFAPERLKVVANKILNGVANSKRDGSKVVRTLIKDMIYKKGNNISMNNMVTQGHFLTQLLKNIETSPDKVINDFENLRALLLTPSNFRVYVVSNINSLPANPNIIWQDMFFKDVPTVLDSLKEVQQDSIFKSNQLAKKIIGVGSVESAFLYQSSTAVDRYDHPDYPVILVFIEYLCGLEGPLWRQIRGLGLSYNYAIHCAPAVGTLTFILSKSTHVFNAYKKAKEVVEDFTSGRICFDYGCIEAARSGAIFQIIEGETTIGNAVSQAILAEFKQIPSTFHRDLIAKISSVTADDLKRVGETYFTKLFDASFTTTALCCHPTKVKETVSAFSSIGVFFETVSSLDEEILKKLETNV